MPNIVPDTYPAPDPLSVSTGLALTARRVAPLPAAIAWNRAHLGARSLIAQSWPERAGRWQWQTHAAAYPAEPCAVWRIPALPGRTTVQVYAVAFTSAARTTHEILVGSVGSGASVVLTPSDVPGLLGPATLAINTAGGYDEIRAWARADGVRALYVCSIMVKAPPLPSPLPAGSVGGYVATDPDEYAVLRPLDALEGRQMLSDLEAIEETPQVYAQWSAITGGEVDPDDGRTLDKMHARPHSVVGPVWDRTERLHRTLSVHARLSAPSGGGDRVFALNAGAGWDVYDPARAVIVVPEATAPTWYDTTVQLVERRTPMPLPRGLSSTMLTVWPVGTYRQDALGPAHGHVSPAALTTCAVHSLSVWGI